MMRNEFGCPCQVQGRLCNYDLTRWILAGKPENAGQQVHRVTCPYCGQTSLMTVDWRPELVPHIESAVPEKGAG